MILVELGIGQGKVNVFVIRCRSPFDSPKYSSLADSGLPNGSSFPIRIQFMHHTRFLSGDKCMTPVWQFNQNRRRPKIEVWSRDPTAFPYRRAFLRDKWLARDVQLACGPARGDT